MVAGALADACEVGDSLWPDRRLASLITPDWGRNIRHVPSIIGMRLALNATMHSDEKRSVTRTIDIRLTARLGLALLLVVAVVAPVCLVMSPSMAMASEAPAEGCNVPTAPTAECPQLSAASRAQSTGVPAPDVTVALEPVPIVPEVPRESRTHQAVAPVSQRPVAQLTPLRL